MKRIRHNGAVLAGYLLLTVVMTWPLATRFISAIPGDSFDGWQNYWNLWWIKTAVLGQHTQPWFTNLLYYPTGVGLLFHTLNAFNGFTFLPVQLAWGLIPAYNAVVIFSFTMGGFGAYLLARQVLGRGSSRLAAFVSGVVFAFSPYHVAHLLGHMQLIALEWLPFYALYLIRATGSARGVAATSETSSVSSTPSVARPFPLRDAGMAVLFLALVALCDWYYVMYCAILTAIVVIWRLVPGLAMPRARAERGHGNAGARTPWLRPGNPALTARSTSFRLLAVAAGIWLVWGLAFSPLLAPMVREAVEYDFMQPDPAQFRVLSADLQAFVTPQEFHPLWGEWAQRKAEVFASTVSEHQVFAGFSVLALAALGFFGLRRRHAWFWLATALVFFVLSLGPVLHIAGQTRLLPGSRELPLPYALLSGLPFMNISRSISRFDVMVMLALGVLAAGGVAWLMRRLSGAAGRVAALVVIALVAFEFLPAPYPTSPPDTPGWYQTLATDPRARAVLNLPVNWDRPWYLLYQTVHGKPLTAAYISREDPRTLVDRAPVLQYFRHLGPDIISLASPGQGRQVLADLGVGWVVLDRYKMPGGPEREVTEAGAAELFRGQQPAYKDERLTVYEVARPSAEAAYPILGVGWGPLDEATRTRAFVSSAPVIIQSPGAREAVLRIETAPGSAELDLPQVEGAYELRARVQPGPNEVVLRTVDQDARAVVTRLSISP